MHKHMRAQQTQMHVFLVCFFTYVCRHAHMHIHMHHAYAHARIYMSALVCAYMYYVYVYDYMYIFDLLLIVCGCLCMHKHMRAQQTQMHVFFVMCFLTWGASADACSSRAQGTPPKRQRDQRTAAGRVRPAHIAYVSARPRKRSATPLAPSRAPLFGFHHFFLAFLDRMGSGVCVFIYVCMHACMPVFICVCMCMCMYNHMRAQQTQVLVFLVCFLTYACRHGHMHTYG